MQAKLPICYDPILSQLPRYAHALNILFVNKRQNYLWFINTFTQLSYDSISGTLCNARFDWMYTEAKKFSYECGLFPVELRSDFQLIFNFVLAMLENKRYCIVRLDEYFCKHTRYANQKHHLNEYLIYGAESTGRRILLCYSEEDHAYTSIEMEFDEFICAIDCPKQYFVVHCFKEVPDQVVNSFDLETFWRMVDNSVQSAVMENNCDMPDSSISALAHFVDRLKSHKYMYIDEVEKSLLSLYEYHTIMLHRLLWLYSTGILAKRACQDYMLIQNIAKDVIMFFENFVKEKNICFHHKCNIDEWQYLVSALLKRLTELIERESLYYVKLRNSRRVE